MTIKNAVLIAGPTASGKSALALKYAKERDGIIVNTDSMQVYDVLEKLTARPSVDELEESPHVLYGHVHPADSYSVAAWLADAERAAGQSEGRCLIFTGGTGLYFKALLGGISDIPAVPSEVRERWRYRLSEDGATRLHRHLWTLDPAAAESIKPNDGQRIVRALEVQEATGKPLTYWQGQPGRVLVDADSAGKIVLLPDREFLAERIDTRFDAMVDGGATGEVQRLLDLKLDPKMPAMKAIGVPELAAYLAGDWSIEQAKEAAKTATRRYAKRQMTWFRNQLDGSWKTQS